MCQGMIVIPRQVFAEESAFGIDKPNSRFFAVRRAADAQNDTGTHSQQ